MDRHIGGKRAALEEFSKLPTEVRLPDMRSTASTQAESGHRNEISQSLDLSSSLRLEGSKLNESSIQDFH